MNLTYLAYIAGKYTTPNREKKKEYIKKAEDLAIKILKEFDGTIIPIIPHKNSFDFEFYLPEWTQDDWLEKYCYPIIDKCDLIIISNGYNEKNSEDNSYGVIKEIEYCKKNYIPVFFNNDDLIDDLNAFIAVDL